MTSEMNVADVERWASALGGAALAAYGIKQIKEGSATGGKLGHAVAWLFGQEPSQTIREDLRRFKQLMETGELPRAE